MQLQLEKSLVYFDDAEKDLNIQMYNEGKQAFETLENEEWERAKAFFERFVLKR